MLITKKKGKSKVLSREFCLFDSETEQRALQFLHIIAKMYAVTPQLLNQRNKIRETEVWIYPSSVIISAYLLLKTSLRPHQTRVCRTGFREIVRICLFSISA